MLPTQPDAFEARARRIRTRLAFGALYLFIGFILLSLRDELSRVGQFPSFGWALVGGAMVTMGFSFFLLLYLRGDFAWAFASPTVLDVSSVRDNDTRRVREILSEVRDLRTEFSTAISDIRSTIEQAPPGATSTRVAVDLSNDQRQALAAAVIAGVSRELGAELSKSIGTRVDQLEQQADQLQTQKSPFEQAGKCIEGSIQRLRQEIFTLGRRGDVNLIIGSIITLFAAGLLVYTAVQTTPSSDWLGLLQHYVPRVTTVVFAEVFAFFFLRLYKSGLEDIRFYQNELTNLQLRAAALDAAAHEGLTTTAAEVLRALVADDRNRNQRSNERSDNGGVDHKEILTLIDHALKLSKGQ